MDAEPSLRTKSYVALVSVLSLLKLTFLNKKNNSHSHWSSKQRIRKWKNMRRLSARKSLLQVEDGMTYLWICQVEGGHWMLYFYYHYLSLERWLRPLLEATYKYALAREDGKCTGSTSVMGITSAEYAFAVGLLRPLSGRRMNRFRFSCRSYFGLHPNINAVLLTTVRTATQRSYVSAF